MIFDTTPIKQLLKLEGMREEIDLSDEEDFAYISSWGVPVPKIILECKKNNCGKYIDVVVDENLLTFLEEVLKTGGNYREINIFFKDIIGISIDSRKMLIGTENYERVQKHLLSAHKDSLINFVDFNEIIDVRLAESKYKSRLSLMSKLDKSFKEDSVTENDQRVIINILKPDDSDNSN